MTTAVYAYPWNLCGADDAVARASSLGADEITLAVSYHAGKFIHPGDSRTRVYFPEDGSTYFRPRKSYGELKPRLSALTTERDLLAELCDRDDIGVNAWTVLNHNTRLGMSHLHWAVHNAFGDPYPYSLCPSQPEVRAYAVTLCTDIADAYPVRRLLLETPGFLTYGHGFHHEFALVPPNPWLDAMLGLCFCDRCRDRARVTGIDADALAERVRAAIDLVLDGETAAPLLEDWNAADPDLAAFHRFRCDVVTSLVAEIRAAVNASVKVKVISTCQRPHATAYLEGHDLAALDAVCDGLELPLYQPTPEAVLDDARYVLAQVATERTSVILRPSYPDMASEADLVATLDGLRALGLRDFAFYNLGMLRPVNLRWLQRAVAEQKLHV